MSPYRPQAEDCTEAVDREMMARFAAMSPVERLRIGERMSQALHELSVAGLRLRYPDASEEELQRRAGALRLGKELTLKHYGPEAEAWFDE